MKMLRPILLVSLLLFGLSFTQAQLVPISSFGNDAEWGRPVMVDGQWLDIITNNAGSYLVKGDSARFISTFSLDRIVHDGRYTYVLDDGENRFLPAPSNVYQLNASNTAIHDNFSLMASGVALTMLDAIATDSSAPALLVTGKVRVEEVPFLSTYDLAMYFDNGQVGEIGNIRGAYFPGFQDYPSHPIGLAVKDQVSLYVARIPGQDMIVAQQYRSYAYSFQFLDKRSSINRISYTELSGEPIGLYSLSSGFALVTTKEVFFLNDNGEEVGVVQLPEGFIATTAMLNNLGDGILIVNQLNREIGFQTMIDVDVLGSIRNQYQTGSNSINVKGLYRSDQGGIRVQYVSGGRLNAEEISVLSQSDVFVQSITSPILLPFSSYPISDTIGRSISFSERSANTLDSLYLQGVYFTNNGNVIVDYGNQKQLRSSSGQYMSSVPDLSLIDSTLVNEGFQDRLRAVGRRLTFRDATLSYAIELWRTPSSAFRLSGPVALPGGLVMVKETSTSVTGVPSIKHLILDTLSNLHTTIDLQNSEPVAYSRGLVFTGFERTLVAGILPVLTEHYQVYPYHALRKPAELFNTLYRCADVETVTFYDEVQGVDRTVQYTSGTSSVYIDGVRFDVNVVDRLEPSAAIREYVVDTPCESSTGSLEVILTDAASIDSVFISNQLRNPLVFSGNTNHSIRLVDTAGCVADTFKSVASHEFGVSVVGTCYGDDFGRITITNADSVLFDGNYDATSSISNLRPGDYQVEAYAFNEGCSMDRTVTVVEYDSIGIAVDQTPIGDSVFLSVRAIDPTVTYRYGWNTTSRASRDNATFTAFAGDTVVLLSRFDRGFCRRVDTIYTQEVVNTSSAASLSTVKVFPNPFRDHFILESSASTFMRMVDVHGRLVLEKPVMPGRTTHSLNGLPSGSYTLLFGAQDAGSTIRVVKLE